MLHKIRRAVQIWRDQGTVTLGRKAARYAPIEVDNLLYRARQGRRTRIMRETWDTLVILDGCRYDLFEERNTIDGVLEHRYSLGSTSEEFLQRNFAEATHHNTVYVNANPYVPYLSLDAGTFHAVVDLLDDWDDELETVRPETVADTAIDAHREFPHKRLIVHFMQPHVPFIGATGQALDTGGWEPDQEGTGTWTIWQHLREHPPESEAGIDLDRVWTAYGENLGLVLGQTRRVLAAVDGKTVVTADHGNMVGERLGPIPTERLYGHPYGVYHPHLVKVPWLRVEGEKRRDVHADPPRASETLDDEVTAERLEALGYK